MAKFLYDPRGDVPLRVRPTAATAKAELMLAGRRIVPCRRSNGRALARQFDSTQVPIRACFYVDAAISVRSNGF